MNKNCGVYKIENQINGKMYAGKTIQKFKYRFSRHKNGLRNNKHFNDHLQNSWNKYGADNFNFEPWLITDNEEQALKIESCLIRYYELTNSENGYNDSIYHTVRSGKLNPMYGKDRNITWGDKISESHQASNNPNWKGGKVVIECELCGKERKVVPAKVEKSKYCSRSCSSKASSHITKNNLPEI